MVTVFTCFSFLKGVLDGAVEDCLGLCSLTVPTLGTSYSDDHAQTVSIPSLFLQLHPDRSREPTAELFSYDEFSAGGQGTPSTRRPPACK